MKKTLSVLVGCLVLCSCFPVGQKSVIPETSAITGDPCVAACEYFTRLSDSCDRVSTCSAQDCVQYMQRHNCGDPMPYLEGKNWCAIIAQYYFEMSDASCLRTEQWPVICSPVHCGK